eukprot:m.306496 g.306496  ORF g.306496 m.306496 type:complete len:66 (+) comp41298_c0_seq1:653-850(+)
MSMQSQIPTAIRRSNRVSNGFPAITLPRLLCAMESVEAVILTVRSILKDQLDLCSQMADFFYTYP